MVMKDFNNQLTIYETPPVSDGVGGFTEGTEVEIVSIWGKVKRIQQKRLLDNGALLTITGVEIKTRWMSEYDTFGGSDEDLQLSWRIGFNGQTFQIHTIEDVDYNKRFAKITAWTL